MYVRWTLDLFESTDGECVLVVDCNSIFVHNRLCNGVVFCGISNDSSFGSLRDRSRRSPDEFRVRLLEFCDNGSQIRFVCFWWHLLLTVLGVGVCQVLALWSEVFQVVQAEVEVNHVPFAVSQPRIDFRDAVCSGSAVC